MAKGDTIYFSQVLDRAMNILSCFSAENPELRLVELVELTKLHKSTLYRLLGAMRSYGLIQVDPASGAYRLGLKLFELGSLAIARTGIEKHAHPILEKLAGQTGETAHLCVLDGSDVVYVAKVESRRTLRIPSAVGQRNPAYCTGVGKVLLAHLSEERLSAYFAQTTLNPFTRRTIKSAADLRAELKIIRTQGYSIDDQEREEGVRCVGAPVRDHSGAVVAAISIAGPSMRVMKERVPELAGYVMAAADLISAQAGYGSSSPQAKSMAVSGNAQPARRSTTRG